MSDMVARLDDLGQPAWIAVMVLGFVLFWPVGLAILAYLIWSGRMGCGRHSDFGRWQSRMNDRFERGMRAWGASAGTAGPSGFARTGNQAFDEYREATLRRLEEESREFGSFLERLRMAKDRAEFDQFMADRRTRGPDAGDAGKGSPGGPAPAV